MFIKKFSEKVLLKYFLKVFDDRHCVAMLRQHISVVYRVAVHNVCVVHVHNFFFLSRSGTQCCVQQSVAQVYTRDATHRPTATWTPGRGTFMYLGFLRNF